MRYLIFCFVVLYSSTAFAEQPIETDSIINYLSSRGYIDDLNEPIVIIALQPADCNAHSVDPVKRNISLLNKSTNKPVFVFKDLRSAEVNYFFNNVLSADFNKYHIILDEQFYYYINPFIVSKVLIINNHNLSHYSIEQGLIFFSRLVKDQLSLSDIYSVSFEDSIILDESEIPIGKRFSVKMLNDSIIVLWDQNQALFKAYEINEGRLMATVDLEKTIDKFYGRYIYKDSATLKKAIRFIRMDYKIATSRFNIQNFDTYDKAIYIWSYVYYPLFPQTKISGSDTAIHYGVKVFLIKLNEALKVVRVWPMVLTGQLDNIRSIRPHTDFRIINDTTILFHVIQYEKYEENDKFKFIAYFKLKKDSIDYDKMVDFALPTNTYPHYKKWSVAYRFITQSDSNKTYLAFKTFPYYFDLDRLKLKTYWDSTAHENNIWDPKDFDLTFFLRNFSINSLGHFVFIFREERNTQLYLKIIDIESSTYILLPHPKWVRKDYLLPIVHGNHILWINQNEDKTWIQKYKYRN